MSMYYSKNMIYFDWMKFNDLVDSKHCEKFLNEKITPNSSIDSEFKKFSEKLIIEKYEFVDVRKEYPNADEWIIKLADLYCKWEGQQDIFEKMWW